VSAPAASSPRWLHGPVPDLLLGCGLGYVLVFALLSVAGPEVRRLMPVTLAPLLLLVSGTPHYGATLLRVYERREDRRAYALFAVHATLLVAAAFVAGLHHVGFGSLLLTVYLTWSPWHYTGQNYGIALLLLGRRGIAMDAATKRCVYVSFLLSYVLVVLAIHAGSGADYAPVAYQGSVYRLLPLGIPSVVAGPAVVLAALGWLASGAAATLRLRRRAGWAELSPAVAVAGSQALWFAAPVLARHFQVLGGVEPLSVDHSAYAFLWIAVAHSVQYLWITSYYARRTGEGSGERFSEGRYLAAALLAGAALWTVPGVLFAPALLGPLPYDAGLAVMITAAVNLHHFILDGAIWKLRDGRIARVLLRSAGAAPAAERAPRGRGWLRPLVQAAGVVGVVATVVASLEIDGVTRAAARGDVRRLRDAERRLHWLGRDSPALHAQLAVLEAEGGDVEAALREAQASLDLFPTAEGWRALGDVHWLAGQPAPAIGAWRHALELRPGWVEVLNNLAWVRATHPDLPYRNSGEAVRLAEQAAAASGYRIPEVLDTLGAAYAAAGRYPAALRVTRQAITLAEAQSRPDVADRLRGRLERYRAGRAVEEPPPAVQWIRTRPANPSS
jgi:tetratricopeptide (TPR) repeat protein